jgi:hypothetical protein
VKKSICFTGRRQRSAWLVGSALAWLWTASAALASHADEVAGHEEDAQSPLLPEKLGQPSPALPLIPLMPPSSAKSSIEELNEAVMEIDCAWLRGRVSADGSAIISGTVPDADQKARLGQLVRRFFPDGRSEIIVDIVPPPLCRTLAELNIMRLTGLLVEGGAGLRLNAPCSGKVSQSSSRFALLPTPSVSASTISLSTGRWRI